MNSPVYVYKLHDFESRLKLRCTITWKPVNKLILPVGSRWVICDRKLITGFEELGEALLLFYLSHPADEKPGKQYLPGQLQENLLRVAVMLPTGFII